MRRRGSQILTAAALGLVVAFALVGCDGQSEVSGDKYSIYVQDALFPREGEDGVVFGRLVTRDGCVLLEEGDIAFPVIWPRGTSIASEDPLTLELPSGENITMGERVRGGGGLHDPSSPKVKVEISADCLLQTNSVGVFNADDDPVVVE
ncbi:MAG: hypothetical protein ACOC5M_00720 [Chloroflexota bacterium]